MIHNVTVMFVAMRDEQSPQSTWKCKITIQLLFGWKVYDKYSISIVPLIKFLELSMAVLSVIFSLWVYFPPTFPPHYHNFFPYVIAFNWCNYCFRVNASHCCKKKTIERVENGLFIWFTVIISYVPIVFHWPLRTSFTEHCKNTAVQLRSQLYNCYVPFFIVATWKVESIKLNRNL